MALGYEGYVQVGGKYALGTGTSVPRATLWIQSGGGYGGQIKTPVGEIGIDGPGAFDWEVFDGSVNFELTREFFVDVMFPWVFDRQSPKTVLFSSRGANDPADANLQQYNNAFWSGLSLSASEGAAVEGSISFVAIEQTDYVYGPEGMDGFLGNKTGQGFLCPPGTFPKPLNIADGSGRRDVAPIPYWNTKILFDGTDMPFLNWSLDFSQDVVKFFQCNGGNTGTDAGPLEPAYLAVGPMSIKFTGTYMFVTSPDDNIGQIELWISDYLFKLNDAWLGNVSDDVQSADSLVPLSVEFSIWNLDQTI